MSKLGPIQKLMLKSFLLFGIAIFALIVGFLVIFNILFVAYVVPTAGVI